MSSLQAGHSFNSKAIPLISSRCTCSRCMCFRKTGRFTSTRPCAAPEFTATAARRWRAALPALHSSRQVDNSRYAQQQQSGGSDGVRRCQCDCRQVECSTCNARPEPVMTSAATMAEDEDDAQLQSSAAALINLAHQAIVMQKRRNM